MTTTDSGTRDDTVPTEDSVPGAYALQTPEEIMKEDIAMKPKVMAAQKKLL